MNKIKNIISDYWIFIIIVIQPILDIVSYFQISNNGNSYTWLVRIMILFFIILYTFVKSSNKKRIVTLYGIYILYFILHITNLYRDNTLNLINDTKYFIMVFQMPLIFIALTDYICLRKKHISKIKSGLVVCYIILFLSIFLSCITNTYQLTYNDGGIIGWFSSANTISMILCALAPWVLYIGSQKKVPIYLITNLIIFITLYTNGTKSCYLTLIASIFILLFNLILTKDQQQKKSKIIITTLFLVLSVFGFKYSITNLRLQTVNITNEEYNKVVNNIEEFTPEINDFEEQKNNDNNMLEKNDLIKKLETSYIYRDLIKIHGEEKVLEALNYKVPNKILQDNRFRKRLNAKIEYINSDITTKVLGIGYSRIDFHKLDLENDLTAIFYYYGILGFIIYISLPIHILFRMLKEFLNNKKVIFDQEYIILAFIIVLLIFGGEYSGAFLRKANANILLSLYLILAFFKIQKKELNNKKISFLLLHLGYGGIESSTINTANALSDKYKIELVSFYNLKKNQEEKINKNISIKYLYNGSPNKDEFLNSIKNKNIIKIFKEGFKSLNILIKKKILIIKYIKNCDSKYIVSTRVEFSELLSEYGNSSTIKIAQEHHHHNNNKKYIKRLKNNYSNINYLCALTTTLKKDYEKFLKNNRYTKVILVPNMITYFPKKKTDLKKKNFISVSRLDEGKKNDEIIRIFSKIYNKNSELYIIGDGKEFDNLKKLIQDLKLSKKVHLLGYLNREEIEKYMLKSSIFLMASISEGLPMVLLESMSYGVPCIAYETESGTCDIIDNNKNGFIIKDRNEKEYIEKINYIINDFGKLKEFSNNAISKSKEFSKEEVLKIWYKILR